MFVTAVCIHAQAQPSLIEQGRAALERGDPLAAQAPLEKAVAQSPGNPEAHFLLADAYGAQINSASIFRKPGLASKTHQELERTLQLDPDFVDARFALIQYFLQAPAIAGGGEDKAVAQANEIRKRDAIDGHRGFAEIYYQQKKPDLARKEYLDAVREQPNAPRARYWLGVSYFFDRNWSAAGAEFDRAVELDPAYMPGWFQVGHVAAMSGNGMERGEQALRKYLASTPKRDEPPLYRAHYWLGMIFEKQGKKAEARASYKASLSANPNQKDVQAALKRLS